MYMYFVSSPIKAYLPYDVSNHLCIIFALASALVVIRYQSVEFISFMIAPMVGGLYKGNTYIDGLVPENLTPVPQQWSYVFFILTHR